MQTSTERGRKWRANNKQHYKDYQRAYKRAYRAAKKATDEKK